MNLLSARTTTDSAAAAAADLGTSPPLHDRLQHLTLRKKTSYR